jgi:hypothetical protein
MQRKRLRAITKSVADWTWRHMSTAGFSARQSRIGTRGNAKRWADHIPTEVTKPWEAEGIHRATWYRSDRVNENGATRMDGERQRWSATIVLSDSSLLVGSAQTTAPLLVARRDCGGTQQLRVVVFRGELPKVAIARHMELRPEHRDRRIRLEYRNDTRKHVNELFAVHNLGEIRAVMEAISLQNTGNLGEQIAKRRAAWSWDQRAKRANKASEKGTSHYRKHEGLPPHAEGRGKPIGEQVLADAHGWDDESNRANHPD